MIGPKAYIFPDRLKKNVSNIRNHVDNRKMMVVVKANGYGHGLLNIANILANEPNIIFCVFTIEEAISLREDGINNDILIFSRIQSDWINKASELNLWINACHWDDLILLNQNLQETGLCPKIHLKFDTGMTRLGFDISDADKVFGYLLDNPKMPVEGIYSHFSTADEGDLSFSKHQLGIFNSVIGKGKENGIYFDYIHCSNSGALLNIPDSYFNTVRVGMLVYGVSPSEEVDMTIDVDPVMSFCGPIVNLRRVKAGTDISYGGVYKTDHETNIGVVQTGFADGFPRPWYKKGYISYKGAYYKIAGRVCMDQFMVDFGNTSPTLGDEVLIFGKNNNDNIPIEKIAKNIETTTYVLLTAIQGRTEYIIL